MAGSTLDPDNLPPQRARKTLKGHDAGSLGPSDTSDSAQDMAGPGLLDEDRLHLDRGTNEDTEAEPDADRGFDRVVGAGEAGLGGGLDQAEEARLGKTDEEIAAEEKRKLRKPRP